MAAETDIVNAALVALGELPITSLNDNRKAARLATIRYPQVRDAVLRAHPWNCALKRKTISAAGTAPAFGYANAYKLPADFLRLVRLQDHSQIYEIENGFILTDASSVGILYVAQVTDVTKMDHLLREVIAIRLGSEVSVALAKSGSLSDLLEKRYDRRLAEARSISAQETPTRELLADEWDDARMIGVAERYRPIESA